MGVPTLPIDPHALDALSPAASPHGAWLIGSAASSASTSDPPTVAIFRITHAIPRLPVPSHADPTEWHADHARTVLTTLPGGLFILGAYNPTAANDSNDDQLKVLACKSAVFVHPDPISNSAGIVAKVRNVHHTHTHNDPDDTTALKPAQLTVVPYISRHFVVLRGTLRTPSANSSVFLSPDDTHTQGGLVKAATALMGRLVVSFSVENGKDDNKKDSGGGGGGGGDGDGGGEKIHSVVVVHDDDPRVVADVLGYENAATSSSSSEQPEESVLTQSIDVSLPLKSVSDSDATTEGESRSDSNDSGSAENDSKEDVGRNSDLCTIENLCRLTDSLALVATVPRDATLGDALRAVREDAVRSLRARFDLLSNSNGDDTGDRDKQQSLPTRVVIFTAPPKPALPFVYYLTGSESVDNGIRSRLIHVMSWTVSQLDDLRLNVDEIVDKLKIQSDRSEERKREDEDDDTVKASVESIAVERNDEDGDTVKASVESIAVERIDDEVDDVEDFEGPPLILLYSVLFPIVLAFIAIIIRQFL